MCGLFGFYNYGGKPVKDLKTLTNSLAQEALVRGIDATGIAYCDDGKLVIHKEPKSAVEIDFKHPDSTVVVMGHTRHATQGKESCNFNNHPFSGTCKNMNFALAHNGVLSNDRELKRKFKLPKTKIETDSYVAVQLLRHRKKLNIKNLKFMAEQVRGSFAFTVLGTDNVLRFIRGDSPLSLFHFPEEKIYVYASTESILLKGLIDTWLLKYVTSGRFERVKINSGDIVSIFQDGTLSRHTFEYKETSYGRYNWWNYGCYSTGYFYDEDYYSESTYIEDLKSVAKAYGYDETDVDNLLRDGFTPDEIEEYIYCAE